MMNPAQRTSSRCYVEQKKREKATRKGGLPVNRSRTERRHSVDPGRGVYLSRMVHHRAANSPSTPCMVPRNGD